MVSLKTRFRRMIKEKFPGAEIHLDRFSASGRVTGTLTWDGFERKDPFERQRMLREAIRKTFGQEEQYQIGSILTFTSHELVGMREG